MPVDAQQLQKLGLFKDLDLPLLSQLATHSRLTAYETDETVFQEGDPCPPASTCWQRVRCA